MVSADEHERAPPPSASMRQMARPIRDDTKIVRPSRVTLGHALKPSVVALKAIGAVGVHRPDLGLAGSNAVTRSVATESHSDEPSAHGRDLLGWIQVRAPPSRAWPNDRFQRTAAAAVGGHADVRCRSCRM